MDYHSRGSAAEARLAPGNGASSAHPPNEGRAPASATDRLACLTLDVEPDEPIGPGIRLFEEPARFAWFCDMLRDAEAALTAFVVMHHAEHYASALAELGTKIPVELAVHSYKHDRRETASADEVRRARDCFVKLWGGPPKGYRAPYGLIDGAGLRALIGEGFAYDSSIFPTLRIDEFGYNHLRYPRDPFLFEHGQNALVEVPVAALRGCRLIYSLSFIKLFGPGTMRQLMRVCPLPRIAVIDLHPYDLYADRIVHVGRGWKRLAHLRNARRAPAILIEMVETLRSRGYRFVSVAEAAALAAAAPSTPRLPVPPR